jgi:hypothetical protein
VALNDFIKKFGKYGLYGFYWLTILCKIYLPVFQQSTAIIINMTPKLFYHILHANAVPFWAKTLESKEELKKNFWCLAPKYINGIFVL